MDIFLGPWKAAQAENKALADAMGDEAKKTVTKADGFTAHVLPKGGIAKTGFTIAGTVKSVVKEGRTAHVFTTYAVAVGNSLSNITNINGTGFAEGSSTAEDVVRAITEARVNKILDLINAGTVKAIR